jgi:hypothetical protein
MYTIMLFLTQCNLEKLIYIFDFLFSQHVSALAGHHQVFLLMLELLNCIDYHFLTSHVP